MIVFSLMNQKGGVVKTVSSFNIASLLADFGYKTLLIDLDPQASLTVSIGYEPTELKKTVTNVLTNFNGQNKIKIEETFLQVKDNLILVPSSIDLSVADILMNSQYSREFLLKKAIEPVSKYFDFCIIDCPPSLGILSLNALSASDYVLIPVATSYLAYRGLELLLDTIENVHEALNPDLEIYGVLATLYKNNNHSKEVLTLLKDNYHLIGKINNSVSAEYATIQGKSVSEFNKKSPVAKEYTRITKEIIDEFKSGKIKTKLYE